MKINAIFCFDATREPVVLTRVEFELYVEPSYTIVELTAMIEEQMAIPSIPPEGRLCVSFAGRDVVGERTLADLSVNEGSFIHLCLRRRRPRNYTEE